jgi:hypothetical protein
MRESIHAWTGIRIFLDMDQCSGVRAICVERGFPVPHGGKSAPGQYANEETNAE